MIRNSSDRSSDAQMASGVRNRQSPNHQSLNSLAYDKMGRVVKQTMELPDGSGGSAWLQAQYAFNGDGRLIDLYYPAAVAYSAALVQTGTRYTTSYDLAGRPTGLTHLYQGNWITDVQNVTYNAASQLTQWQESGGTLARSYSATRGWLNSLTASNVLNISYGYHANGQVQTVTDSINPGQSVSSYEYDEVSRLKRAAATNWELRWTYDDFGNRLTQTAHNGTPPQITLAYNESTNRITTSGYQYDLNGNLTTLPGLSVSYDVFDRAVTINSTTAKYDASGRRVERVLAGGTRRVYFHDPSGKILAEYDALVQTRTVVYFAGHRLGQWTDRTGSVRYANSTYRHYYPFGEEITSTAGDQQKFAELYRDADTGLDYAQARYYSSTIGRFITPDPAGMAVAKPTVCQSWNFYAYTRNDPVNAVDPTGLATDLVDLYIGNGTTTGFNGSYCVRDGDGNLQKSLEVTTKWTGDGQFSIKIVEASTNTWNESVYWVDGDTNEVRVQAEVDAAGTQTYISDDRRTGDGDYSATPAPYKAFRSRYAEGWTSTVSWGTWSHSTASGPQGLFGFSVGAYLANGSGYVQQNYWHTSNLIYTGTNVTAAANILHNFANGTVTSFQQDLYTSDGRKSRRTSNLYVRCGDRANYN